jgi:hypothetical protein
MSYYIIPKIKNSVIVNPKYTDKENLNPYISFSLFYYYNNLCQEICKYLKNMNSEIKLNWNFEEIIKFVNPYEYIFSKVPGSNFSVSKLKPKTNLFFDFLELSNTLNIFEPYKNKSIKTLHITPNSNDTIECFEMLRENYSDEIIFYNEINDSIITEIGEEKFHFLFFESNSSNNHCYIISIMYILMIILRNQINEGCCIIKIDNLFYKPIVDMLYLLASLYDKIYILKPNSNNITSFDKYIICKNFQYNENKNRNFKLNYYRMLIFLKKLENKYIESIFDFDIPYYFTTKLEDINIIIGQQQLDSLDVIINILKNKNQNEKIEQIKKSNIQKSVSWCEKYKIPFNKFSEKTNIFLPITKEESNDVFIDHLDHLPDIEHLPDIDHLDHIDDLDVDYISNE